MTGAFEAAARLFEPQPAARWLYDPVGWARDVIAWPTGQELTAYQRDVLGALPGRRRVAVRGPHGLGKALEVSTPVVTPGGWSTVGELAPGDEVFDEAGVPCRVVAVSPIRLGPAYEVELADGSRVVADEGHDWLAVDGSRWVRGVRDWRDRWDAARRVSTGELAAAVTLGSGRRRWRIPTARPLRLPEADLPVDPYLLGVWLGDGATERGRLTLNAGDAPEIIARLPAGHVAGERGGAVTYVVEGLTAGLRRAGVLGRKHIPDVYLRGSVEQRLELVRGLWDSDGYRQGQGCDEIQLTCRELAAGVVELLRTLGLVARMQESDATLNGRVVGRRWRISARFEERPYHLARYGWRPRAGQASRFTQRTIVAIRQVGPRLVRCIEVDSPSRLFLAGDAMIPTHNSALSALGVLWFATTRDAMGWDWKVLTTASAWRHLNVYLWPEIHKWSRRIRWEQLGRDPFNENSEMLALNLKLRWGAASAVASSKPELIEGAHADSLLYLIDEAKIVPTPTWDAIEGAFSGGRLDGLPEAFALAVSTPGPPTGRFYDIHSRKPGLEDWWTRHVTLEEAIAAGRISRDWAQQRARQWGADSALYANRVLGEFHASDEDAVIPLAWVEAAVERWHAWDAAGRPEVEGRRVVGVDVARSGSDSTVLAYRTGPLVSQIETHDQEDTMRSTARVQAAIRRHVGAVPVVDSIGIGAGVIDRLRELREPVLPYTGSAKTAARTRDGEHGFVSVRAAAYWQVRELLDPAFGPELMLPPDELLLSDLTAPTWREVTGVPPKIAIEKKEDLVARLGRSPDRGDAVVMALWAERMAAAAVRSPANAGQGGSRSAAAARYSRPVGAAGGAAGRGGRRDPLL